MNGVHTHAVAVAGLLLGALLSTHAAYDSELDSEVCYETLTGRAEKCPETAGGEGGETIVAFATDYDSDTRTRSRYAMCQCEWVAGRNAAQCTVAGEMSRRPYRTWRGLGLNAGSIGQITSDCAIQRCGAPHCSLESIQHQHLAVAASTEGPVFRERGTEQGTDRSEGASSRARYETTIADRRKTGVSAEVKGGVPLGMKGAVKGAYESENESRVREQELSATEQASARSSSRESATFGGVLGIGEGDTPLAAELEALEVCQAMRAEKCRVEMVYSPGRGFVTPEEDLITATIVAGFDDGVRKSDRQRYVEMAIAAGYPVRPDALMEASLRGMVNIVDLFDEFLPIHAVDDRQRDAVWYAAQGRRFDLLEWLAARGADLDRIYDKVVGPWPLRGLGPEPSSPPIRMHATKPEVLMRETLLGKAILAEDRELFGELLAMGAEPFGADSRARPLHRIAAVGDMVALRTLLTHVEARGIELRDRNGRTALFVAAWFGELDVAETLMSLGADVNAADNYNARPVHAAAAACDVDMLVLLAAGGARLNEVDDSGWRPSQMPLLYGRSPERRAWEDCRATVEWFDEQGYELGGESGAEPGSVLDDLAENATWHWSGSVLELLVRRGVLRTSNDEWRNVAADAWQFLPKMRAEREWCRDWGAASEDSVGTALLFEENCRGAGVWFGRLLRSWLESGDLTAETWERVALTGFVEGRRADRPAAWGPWHDVVGFGMTRENAEGLSFYVFVERRERAYATGSARRSARALRRLEQNRSGGGGERSPYESLRIIGPPKIASFGDASICTRGECQPYEFRGAAELARDVVGHVRESVRRSGGEVELAAFDLSETASL